MKKASKTKKKKFELSLSPKVVIPSLIAITILVFFVFPRIIDYVKFMTLKNDMLALQKEFNKIDPGWEHSESCNANGQKLKENEASSCAISLTNPVTHDTKGYEKILTNAKDNFKISTTNNFQDKLHNVEIAEYSVLYKNRTVNCSLGGEKINNSIRNIVFSCNSSALNFYFPKSQ